MGDFAVPWLRNVLTPSVPVSAAELTDHVIICEYSPRGEAFIQELEARGSAYVVVVSDQETATSLHENGYSVVLGDPESTETLERAGLESAVALIADATDDRNASIVLSARATSTTVRVVTLVEDAELTQYLWAAGADTVLSPRQLLGESLVRELTTTVVTRVEDGIPIDEEFQLVELTIESGSELCDQTMEAARFSTRFGVHVIGAWTEGEFESPIHPLSKLRSGTTLLIAGTPEQLAQLQTVTTSTATRVSTPRVLIAGYGVSERAAREALSGTTVEVTILDRDDKNGVDVVGDARRPDALREAGIEDAAALLVAVGDDTTAIFTTLIARELNPDIEILVRANEHEDVEKLYRAGADYAQSLATVSGRMLVSTVFDDENVLTYAQQIAVVRRSATPLVGTTLAEARVRSETGCTVVAAIRGIETITDIDPDSFRFEAGDEVIIAGTDENIDLFERHFGRSMGNTAE